MRLLLLLLLAVALHCRWVNHEYSAEVSRIISDSIKAKMQCHQQCSIANRALFSNQTFANALIDDLNQAKDTNRKLKEIDNNSAAELFALFGMRDYHCDANGDGVIKGEELKCLNNIWKRHIPD